MAENPSRDEAIRSGPGPSGGERRPAAPSPAEEPAVEIGVPRSQALLGREARAVRSWPITPSLLFLAGAGYAGLSWHEGNLALLVGAALPLGVLAVFFFLTRPAALVLAFAEEGITFQPAGFFLPYDGIHEVFAPERAKGRSFPILLLCGGGHLILPKKMTIPSEELYQFLATQPVAPPRLPDDLDPRFHPFVRQQAAVHGVDRLTIYRRPAWRQKQKLRASWRDSMMMRMALALFLVGIAWLSAAAAYHPRADLAFLLPIGLVALFFGLLFLIGAIGLRFGGAGPRRLRGAMLIVSPSGLALLQGDLTGELRWHEIQKIKLQKHFMGRAGSPAGPGVLIIVPGAQLTIADIYHWPAEHILWLIDAYSRADDNVGA